LENSRRGGHLWLFLAEAVAGQDVRAFGQGLLAAHQVEGVELYPKQDQLADGPGSLIRMPFGVHRLTGQRYGFYTADGVPLAPTIREQIYALKTPETVPETAFEAYRSFVPPQPAVTVTEPPEELTGTLSERIKASVTVLEFVSQYVELKPTASGAVGLCPFHDDHHPSFVNTEGNYWHCFAGCGGGSVIDFCVFVVICDHKVDFLADLRKQACVCPNGVVISVPAQKASLEQTRAALESTRLVLSQRDILKNCNRGRATHPDDLQ
jgi:hypothetical protein